MLNTANALSIPDSIVENVPDVIYLEYLELIYDADILLLIDLDWCAIARSF